MARLLVLLFLAPIALALAPLVGLTLVVVFAVYLVLGPDGVLEARRRHLQRCYDREEARR